MEQIEIFAVEIFRKLVGERLEVKTIDDLIGLSLKLMEDGDGFFLEKSAIKICIKTFSVSFEADDECFDLLFSMYELMDEDWWLFKFDLLNHAQLYL